MFRKKELQRISVPTNFPSGLAVQTEDGFYFIKGKNRYKFFNKRVFDTWSLIPIQGTRESVSQYIHAGIMGFRDGTLIHNIADGKMYLISGNKRRHIINPDVFLKYGLSEDLKIRVSASETDLHDLGEDLD